MMPDKPPPGRESNGWPFSHLRYIWTCLVKWIASIRFPYVIHFCKPRDEWNDWYDKRYDWMISNIEKPFRNIWMDMEVTTMYDRYTMPATLVRGSFRFRKEEDALLYRMVWL